ncbi:hypothetical protein L207DRAFT_538375 [Hyaloscypha variabilis F]|uniref:Uncharacterized protein n=1 Tax=Hyaloscypha variabilis (strain UAMH 11265 / GT02V1 / F) TaxID=1149755 RepID=A0A2J6QUH9_HYAVF|nr:hypothetical protein L207DRAFT_538375 [Hyaloscypha variabilis F]
MQPTTPASVHPTSTGTPARANAATGPCLSPAVHLGKSPGVLRARTKAASTNNDYCQNTGWGSTWCQAPPEYPPETCPGKQKGCADKNECECPAPMLWDDSSKECKYQPMPEPSCPPLQSPYCGKSKEEWCSYG